MSIKQAKLIVKARKHNLLNSFCNNGFVYIEQHENNKNKSVKKSRERERERERALMTVTVWLSLSFHGKMIRLDNEV